MNLSCRKQLIACAYSRYRPSQTPGGDDGLPEEHTKTRNHDNPKDKSPRVGSKILSYWGSAGRDRSCETTRSPASEPTSPDIDEDFLNRPLAADARGRAPGRPPEAAEWGGESDHLGPCVHCGVTVGSMAKRSHLPPLTPRHAAANAVRRPIARQKAGASDKNGTASEEADHPNLRAEAVALHVHAPGPGTG